MGMITTGKSLALYIADEKIAEVPEQVFKLPTERESIEWADIEKQSTKTWEMQCVGMNRYSADFEYYYRRGDIYYFRNPKIGFIKVEPDGDDAKKLMRECGIKKGVVYNIKFTIDDRP